MRYVLLFLLLISFLAACQSKEETSKSVEMYNTSGDMVGTANLLESPDGIQVKLKLEGLTPGFHGIAVYEYAKCEGPDFKTAGNHLNPEGKEHGLMHPEGPHLGDLPNIEADAGGLVDAELMLPQATLKEGKKSVLRGEGTSLIVSELQDDGVSQPSGNAGARIICGEIKTGKKTEATESPTDPTEFNEEQQE